MKIIYLLSVVSQVRYQKRVRALERFGAQSEILAFERNYYPGKPWPQGYHSLGHVQHGNYFRRLPILLKAMAYVRSATKAADVIYTFGLDTLLIAWLASRYLGKKVKIVYEVGDIRKILTRDKKVSQFLRWLERYLVRRIDLVVVTSDPYISGYFHDTQKLYNVQYQTIENKLDETDVASLKTRDSLSQSPANNNNLRIGYFGLLRCRRSWQLLREVVKRSGGQIELYMRGIFTGLKDLEDEILSAEFVEYGGPYVSPDELASLYKQVDLVWIAHAHEANNYLWARANRFYEACYFKRPMIAQVGTQDGEVVTTLNIGKNIDLLDIEQAIEEVLEIGREQIQIWHDNFEKLPQDIYLYTDEHKKLFDELNVSVE